MTSSNDPMHWAGTVADVVTPMHPDGRPDRDSLESLLDHLIDGGVGAIAVLGDVGEGSALRRDDRITVAAAAASHVAERVPLAVSLPSLGLGDALVDAEIYGAVGIDALLVAPPLGTALGHGELEDFYAAILEGSGGVPLLVDVRPPRRSPTEGATVRSLVEAGVVQGIVDRADSPPLRSADWPAPELGVAVGRVTDDRALRLARGGHACVLSSLASAFWEVVVGLTAAAADDDWTRASGCRARLVDLAEACGARSDATTSQYAGVLKAALVRRGVIDHGVVATPAHPIDASTELRVADVVRRYERALGPPARIE